MLVLESVAVAYGEPGSERVPFGFGVFFPRAVRAIRRDGSKADWISLLYRPSSRSLTERLRTALRAAGGPHFAHSFCDPLGRPIIGPLLDKLIPQLCNLSRSDHSHAWDRGIPAVCVTDTADFRYSAYHTPDDLPDRLNYDFLTRVVAGIATALTTTHTDVAG